MALTDTDKAWIRKQLRPGSDRRGLGRVGEFIKEWSGTGAVVAILIFLLTQWTSYVEFRTHTADRLDTVEAQLRDLRASRSPSKVLDEIAQVSPKAFEKNLPALRQVAQQPISEVKPKPVVLNEITYQLRLLNEGDPDYWPTVLRFIQFASAGLSPNAPLPGPPNLKFTNSFVEGPNVFGTIKSKIVRLDGGTLIDQTFENCRVIFTENPVHMKNVMFIGCAFELPQVENPNPFLKSTTQKLLASNLSAVSIPSL